jgi:hypothetical protein
VLSDIAKIIDRVLLAVSVQKGPFLQQGGRRETLATGSRFLGGVTADQLDLGVREFSLSRKKRAHLVAEQVTQDAAVRPQNPTPKTIL